MFKSTDVLLGNDPIAVNVKQLSEGLQDLELIELLTMWQFKATLSEVFQNWDPVKLYMTEQLHLSEDTIVTISEAELNIPGVRMLM